LISLFLHSHAKRQVVVGGLPLFRALRDAPYGAVGGALSRALFCLLLVASSSAASRAHDLWIEPSTFHPQADDLVKLALRLGHPSAPELVPRTDSSIERFEVLRREEGGATTSIEPQGLEGLDPAGIFRPRASGDYTVVYVSRPSYLELPAERFESYLRQEGLDGIAALRARRGETGASGREAFSRSIKSLLVMPGGALRDQPRGLPLELVLTAADSWAGSARMHLLFEGRPLAGVLVEAMRLGHDQVEAAARSDSDGAVELAIGAGAWLITAVHAEASSSPEADWRSWWASLTFETP
jgi:uncharacterized GH25 family protein